MNERHIAFAEEYLVNGMNATQAYQKAYPTAAQGTCEVNGSRLLNNTKVQEYIKANQAQTAQRNQITKEEILNVVISIMNNDSSRDADRLKATEIIMKALGYNEAKTSTLNITTNSLRDLISFDDDEQDSPT